MELGTFTIGYVSILVYHHNLDGMVENLTNSFMEGLNSFFVYCECHNIKVAVVQLKHRFIKGFIASYQKRWVLKQIDSHKNLKNLTYEEFQVAQINYLVSLVEHQKAQMRNSTEKSE